MDALLKTHTNRIAFPISMPRNFHEVYCSLASACLFRSLIAFTGAYNHVRLQLQIHGIYF